MDNISAPLRLAFLGSGEIAVPVLAALMQDSGIEICFVNTQPDRPAGRKQTLTPTPVGTYAELKKLKLFKLNVNTPEFHALLESEKPEMLVVIDFGQLLKSFVLEFPRHGCINVHASLLPRHRGASPIQSAILLRDDCTGVSFMRMELGLDTGPVYYRVRLPLEDDLRSDDLLKLLGGLAALHAADILKRIAAGLLKPEPQPEHGVTICRKIKKEHGRLDWSRPAHELAACARAYYPWPGLWFMLETPKKCCRIVVTEVTPFPLTGEVSEVLSAGKGRLIIACGEGSLEIVSLIPEGKHEMSAADFLCGTPLSPGFKIENSASN